MRHLDRFGSLPDGFVGAMMHLLEDGELFPRIAEVGSRLVLTIRPAPPARCATRLTFIEQAPDPRTQPLVKGPDFGALAAYRAAHQLPDTDDTIIVGPKGEMLETTTGALVAWDAGTLIVPAGTWLPSITSAQITARARQLGLKVDTRPLYPGDGLPLWFASSLHGISPVRQIVGDSFSSPPPHPEEKAWQQWWWDSFQPVAEP